MMIVEGTSLETSILAVAGPHAFFKIPCEVTKKE